jgi:hypothetical protein
MNITIIGGGIAGLSAATILCEIPNLKITLYEREKNIGGQAMSTDTENCNVEYSWRIFGGMYYNLLNIFFTKLKIRDEFVPLDKNCFIDNNEIKNAYLGVTNQVYAMLSYMKLSDYHKVFELFLHSSERMYKEYDINAYEYSNKNPIVQTILGPFLGMDANKVSLAGAIKNIYSTSDTKKYDFYKESISLLTKNPTSTSIFSHWEKYLREKGVIINTGYEVESVDIRDNKINSIFVKSNLIRKNVRSDEYIFACSLEPILKLFEYKYTCATLEKMKLLKNDMQLYFTINMYFSKKITNLDCRQEIIVDMPWKPIIQRKLTWDKDLMDRCHFNGIKIEEVWNVGFLDYNKGLYNNKILSDCSLEEAIIEGVKQVKENPYIRSIIAEINEDFDTIYIGAEHWYQFKNNSNGKLISTNPKFSINVGTMKNMPEAHNDDMPTNMYLAGYYVNSSVGGVSMEASCETGLIAGKCIIDKYGLKYNDILPIKHDREYLSVFTLPLILLDKVLMSSGLPPITKYLNAVFIIILYILLLFSIFFYIVSMTNDYMKILFKFIKRLKL